jgi:proline dehydrogenase
MLRQTLLFLSRQHWLQPHLQRSRVTRRLVSRFIAGEDLDSAIEVCRRLAAAGIWSTLDHLGENVRTLACAEQSLRDALLAVDSLHREKLPATFSIKLTQFGLDLSVDDCLRLTSQLAERVRGYGECLEIDMESSAYTDRTLAVVSELNTRYGNVRSVIQAYLFRSQADIETMSKQGIQVRLCKGAYLEPADVAFQQKDRVDASYASLAELLLDHGVYPAFATHDDKLIRAIIQAANRRNMPKDAFEFQMLYGVRRDLQTQLTAQGYRLRLYVPYGSAWYPYFMRRLAERPANLLFLLKAMAKN